ncbi:MAG: Nif3-like dinuclear metal center hexameric protein [Gammaproteobacteria bacterium]|nr:Nif3-like dinuclear metal center hexameric protein [Gammaproteobacteria bacterium]
MTNINEIVAYTHSLLRVDDFRDYCPNGLQVEGRSEVQRIVAGVTASQQLVDAAIAARADMLLVHHGYFWRDENPAIVGIKRQRIAALLQHGINLVAYHLPLDAHLLYGNNAGLAAQMGWQIEGVSGHGAAKQLLFYGRLPKALTVSEVSASIQQGLQREPLCLSGGDKLIERIAWCTGGAQGFFEQAIALGVDAYITGEASEQQTHLAAESGVHFIAAGHHATECYGPRNLAAHLGQHFQLEHRFIEISNPV